MTDTSRSVVLVLDDDPLVTRTLSALLDSETDWEVRAFNRAEKAIDALSACDPEVVLSDFLMPGIDGIAFLREVRKTRPFASRILLTGYADKQNAIRSINEVGVYQYLEKPWDNDALLLVLRNASERSRLLRELDAHVRLLAERDRSIEAMRARLLKAIL